MVQGLGFWVDPTRLTLRSTTCFQASYPLAFLIPRASRFFPKDASRKRTRGWKETLARRGVTGELVAFSESTRPLRDALMFSLCCSPTPAQSRQHTRPPIPSCREVLQWVLRPFARRGRAMRRQWKCVWKLGLHQERGAPRTARGHVGTRCCTRARNVASKPSR